MTLCHSHKKKDPFVRFSKSIVFDSSISLKAKGILSIAFSRPDDWTFYKSEMMKHSTDGESSFDSGIKELEESGYLHRHKTQNSKTGIFTGLEWHFFEEPISLEEFKKLYRQGGFPGSGVSPVPGKPGTTKKDCYTKKEKNNNRAPLESQEFTQVEEAKVDACGAVVVPSFQEEKEIQKDAIAQILQKVNLNKSQFDMLKIKIDTSKANLLVKRILSWKDRESDAKACSTILKSWDSWSDAICKEEQKQDEEVKQQSDKEIIAKRREKALELKQKTANHRFGVSDNTITLPGCTKSGLNKTHPVSLYESTVDVFLSVWEENLDKFDLIKMYQHCLTLSS